MSIWYKLGNFLSTYLAYISPLCVLCAVLFPDFAALFNPFVTALFAFMTFQNSLGNSFKNLLDIVRRPAELLMILFLSAIVLPLFALCVARALYPTSPELISGILLEFCVPVAVVSAMWVNEAKGKISLALATMLVSTVLSPFSIPFTLKLLVGATVHVDVLSMMLNMIVTVALPAILAVTLNEITGGRAAQTLSPALAPAAKIALILVILSNSSSVVPYLRHLDAQLISVTFCILFIASASYVLGLVVAVLWKKPAAIASVLCLQTGMRNISAGAVIAAQYLPALSMFPVVIGTLFQQVLAAITVKWLKKYAPQLNSRAKN